MRVLTRSSEGSQVTHGDWRQSKEQEEPEDSERQPALSS